MENKYKISSAGYGVVYIEPAITETIKAKIQLLSRSDLEIEAIEPKLEFIGGNEFHASYGTPQTPRATAVLLVPSHMEKLEELASEIKAVLQLDESGATYES